jgi:hypothetical protein
MRAGTPTSVDGNGTECTSGAPSSGAGLGGRHAEASGEFVNHILGSTGESSVDLRRTAASGQGLPQHLAILVEKIHQHSYKIVDEDIEAALTGCSEDQLFEIILSACVGASEQRVRAGLKAADEAK